MPQIYSAKARRLFCNVLITLSPRPDALSPDHDELTAFDTHWIWQDEQQLTQQAPQIRDGFPERPEGPGLGITLDMKRVDAAHALYNALPDKNRNDAIGMQFLIENWAFDARRPALLRD